LAYWRSLADLFIRKREMPDDQRLFRVDTLKPRLSRRTLLTGAAATTVAISFAEPTGALAQDDPSSESGLPPYGTPVATAEVSVNLNEFRKLCQHLAGIDGDIDVSDESLQQLLGLLLQEEGSVED